MADAWVNMADADVTCCGDPAGLLETRLFKAPCDPTRIAILVRLAEAVDDRTVGQIAEDGPVDTSVVSRHLAALRDAGIVEATRRGKEVYHRVRYRALAATLRAGADAIEACCPSGG